MQITQKAEWRVYLRSLNYGNLRVFMIWYKVNNCRKYTGIIAENIQTPNKLETFYVRGLHI